MPSEAVAENPSLDADGVRLWPYSKGCYRRDFLYQVWKIVEDSGDFVRLFAGSFPTPMTELDARMNLEAFAVYFQDKLLTVIEDTEREEIAGFFWLYDMVAGHRASASVFFAKQYRKGKKPRAAGRLFRDYAIQTLGFKYLWTYTVWDNAAQYAEDLGFKTVTILPELELVDGEAKDVIVLRYGGEE